MDEAGKPGRPPLYTKELAMKVCERIATTTKGLRTICKEEGMPSVDTVFRWIQDDTHGFCELYTRAKRLQAQILVDEIVDISDDSANDTIETENGPQYNKEWVSRSRLRIDTRKWLASKLLPKLYGDKLDLTSDGEKLQPVQFIFQESKGKDETDTSDLQ